MTTTPSAPETTPGPESRPDEPKSPWRWVKWGVLAIVAVVALGYGAIFIYATVLNDAPDSLDEGDLSAALVDEPAGDAADEPVADEPAADPEPVATEAPVEEPAADAVATAGFDGVWVPTDASEFGYRVDEVIAGVNVTAVGRGNQITGELVIDGTSATAIDVEIDVASITSDDGRRDGQFRGRIMETDQFPTATFSLTQPIDFGTIPTEGEQITVEATGDLTLHGVTRSVTFELTAEANADRIGVLGNIPVLFADYDIDNPSFGTISVEDDGLLEFVLVFEQG